MLGLQADLKTVQSGVSESRRALQEALGFV